MSKRMMGRYGGPMAEMAHIPLTFSVVSMTLANPLLMKSLLYSIAPFW
jgi:hypothetical protein